MIFGLFSGIFWAIDSIILSKAILLSPLLLLGHDGVSFVILGFLVRLKEILSLNKKEILNIFFASFCGSLAMFAFLFSILFSSASEAGIFSAFYPIVSVVASKILLRQKLGKNVLLGIIISTFFIFLIAVFGDDMNYFSPLGVIFGLICAFGWGLECVIISRSLSKQINEKLILFIRQGVSSFLAIILFCVLLFFGVEFEIKSMSVLAVAIAAIFGTFSYLLYYKAIATIGVLKAMGLNISYCGWIVIFSLFVDKFNPVLLVCALFVITGSVVSNIKDKI